MRKTPLKCAVICTIRYRDGQRKLRAPMTGASLEAIAKKLAQATEFWMAKDSDIYGSATSIKFSFRPLLSTSPKPKKKS
jgi:hypothetical protein